MIPHAFCNPLLLVRLLLPHLLLQQKITHTADAFRLMQEGKLRDP